MMANLSVITGKEWSTTCNLEGDTHGAMDDVKSTSCLHTNFNGNTNWNRVIVNRVPSSPIDPRLLPKIRFSFAFLAAKCLKEYKRRIYVHK